MRDIQGICGWFGPGPYLIENNYIEGAGEVRVSNLDLCK